LGVMTVAGGVIDSIPRFAAAMIFAGAGWLVFISLISTLVQTLAPDWARARVLAVFVLIFQGGLAAGSAMWGVVATRTGLPIALAIAGVSTIATIVIGIFARLPEATADTTPWNHWRLPEISHEAEAALEHGYVLVAVRYRVRAQHDEAFVRAINDYGRIRRR